MDPQLQAEQMRQARSSSPLLTREQALKQFKEVEAFLQALGSPPKSKLFESTPAEAVSEPAANG